jgi:hypothetical protein
MRITLVGSSDLPELLPLVRAYCDFYQVTPSDRELLELSRALQADPELEGLQLLARDDADRAVGFATLYRSWRTLVAARVGVLNDLSTVKKSHATIPVACWRRNARQVVADRRGAGSSPWRRRMVPFVGGVSPARWRRLRTPDVRGGRLWELRGGSGGGRRLGCTRGGYERSGRPGGLRPSAVRAHRQRPPPARPPAVGVRATRLRIRFATGLPRQGEGRGWRRQSDGGQSTTAGAATTRIVGDQISGGGLPARV